MSLDDFEHAEVQEGYLYELGRGIISVFDVPDLRYGAAEAAIHEQITAYKLTHPGAIRYLLTGSQCKVLLPNFQSERHPDLSIYRTQAPGRGAAIWGQWVADIVIEVVSPESRRRDYEEKRDEYLGFGVREYWIVDVEQRMVVQLRRSGQRWIEKTVRPPKTCRTRLLPVFELSLAAVFAATDDVPE